MLARLLDRLRLSTTLDEIVVATSADAGDDAIEDLGTSLGLRVVRGSQHDVLSRYSLAAAITGADVIVRITADCPLVDSGIVDRVVGELVRHRQSCDYASNVVERTFPRGLDVEAFYADALARMDRFGSTPEEREHVTWVVRRSRPAAFLVRSITDEVSNADLRWTVDEEIDLALIRRLFEDLHLEERSVSYREIVSHVRSHAELALMNTAARGQNSSTSLAASAQEKASR